MGKCHISVPIVNLALHVTDESQIKVLQLWIQTVVNETSKVCQKCKYHDEVSNILAAIVREISQCDFDRMTIVLTRLYDQLEEEDSSVLSELRMTSSSLSISFLGGVLGCFNDGEDYCKA